ncbi:hypothetical protein [Streptomyces sp. NBC_00467]|uniref:hypothetical protein n=1 Tax=Streptomyces sp. NBC_00467 TaxID=2975752 RepID=UPI002E1817F9
MSELPASVDRNILDQRIILALQGIRESLGCSLSEAMDVFGARYEELRRERPGDFIVGPGEYGRGFYS